MSFANAQTVNVALHVWSAAMLFIVLASYRNFMLEIRASRIFFWAGVINFLALVAFTAAEIIGGDSALPLVLRAVFYAALYATMYLFIRYLVVQIQEDHRVNSSFTISVLVFCVVSALIWILSLFDDTFKILQDDAPYFGIYFWIAHIGLFVLLVFSFVLLLMNHKTILPRHTAVLLSMPIIELIAVFAEQYLPGIELCAPSAALAILIIYTQHHLELASTYTKDRFDSIQSRLTLAAGRMQPHYIYNVLTTIYYLIDDNPEKAQNAVGTFSDYLRNTLEAMERDELVSFSWELSQVRNYFNLEKLRFGDRLNMVYDIEVEDFMIPPLTIQPLVENAVKHGLSAKEEGGTVRLITRRLYDGGVQLRVVDDGVGFDVSSLGKIDVTHEGVGNARERLRLQCNGDMEITSAPGKGTSVMITLRSRKG